MAKILAAKSPKLIYSQKMPALVSGFLRISFHSPQPYGPKTISKDTIAAFSTHQQCSQMLHISIALSLLTQACYQGLGFGCAQTGHLTRPVNLNQSSTEPLTIRSERCVVESESVNWLARTKDIASSPSPSVCRT